MLRNSFAPVFILLAGFLIWSGLHAQSTRPNIIFILTDDQGYGDLGSFYQDARPGTRKFDTPYLDSLAAQGMMLTGHYVSASVCAPSRASFLQGLHQGHSHVRNNSFDQPLVDGLNVARLLQDAGYRTIHIGKAGLAGKRDSDHEAHPLRRGFTDFFGYLHHVEGHEHYPRNGTTDKRAFVTDGYETITTGTDKTYTIDLWTARAKAYLIEQAREQPEQPFFLYLAYDTPHNKLQAPTVAYPAGGGLRGGLVYTGPDDTETPYVNTARGSIDTYIHPDFADQDWPAEEKRHAAMIRRIDDAVGDLLQLLKDLGIDDNTLLVFSSDNGPHIEGGQDPTFFRSYGPYTGIKRDVWEAGLRVPTIAHWPGHIPAGSRTAEPVGNWDWLATFAQVAGELVPAFTDGVSLLPLLLQDSVSQGRDREYLYFEYMHPGKTTEIADFPPSTRDRRRGEMQAIRSGKYKGVRYDTQSDHEPFEVYDISSDSMESHNIAGEVPEIQTALQRYAVRAHRPDPRYPRPYDSAQIEAVSLAEPVSVGLSRQPFDTSGHWLPRFPPYRGTATADTVGVFADLHASDPGITWTGYLRVRTAGSHTFTLATDGDFLMDLHDIHLLYQEDGLIDTTYNTVTLNLAAGLHPVTMRYVPGPAQRLNISWKAATDAAPALLQVGDFRRQP